ncbi:MAG: cell division protein FtsQ/DivIB [Terriglobales bacterium]
MNRESKPREPKPHPTDADEMEETAEREVTAADSEAAAYRRRRSPVPVRRRRGWLHYCQRGWKPALIGAVVVVLGVGLYQFAFASSWFVLRGSDQIAVVGAHRTNPHRVLAAFSADLGRNTLFVPLSLRRQEVEQIPWVASAAVLRLWPARLEVKIAERTPVAFARVGGHLDLIDAHGVLLGEPPQAPYQFPVLTGLSGVLATNPNAARWLELRQVQVAQWLAFAPAAAASAGSGSGQVSEVNLAQPTNLRVRVSFPSGGSVLVALGNRNFGPRFQLFQSQIAAWRQKYPNMVSVDLQFDGQAIVDPGSSAPAASLPAAPPQASRSSAKASKPAPHHVHARGSRGSTARGPAPVSGAPR